MKCLQLALLSCSLVGISFGCAAHSVSFSLPTAPQHSCAEASNYGLFPGDEVEVLCISRFESIAEYHIQIGDIIAVRFPSLPEYSSEQPVKPDGTINLPRLPNFVVHSMSVKEAQQTIEALYQQQGWSPEFYLYAASYDTPALALQNIIQNSQSQYPRLIRIRPDGFADFPMLEPIAAAGKSLSTIEAQVQEQYRTLFPRLHFELSLRNSRGPRVFIYGNVSNPGAYPVNGPLLLPELLALAGGPDSHAALRTIVVIKMANDSVHCTTVDTRKAQNFGLSSPAALICPGSIVYVPQQALSTAADFMQEISQILLFKGFGAGLTWTFRNDATTDVQVGQ